MSNPYVGEIRMFGGNFAPMGWAFCDGSLLDISEYDTLFNLIGTTYGGDGQSTFALPDLRGRVPVHMGQGSGLSNYTLGELGGAESVTLSTNQMPAHTHGAPANSVGAATNPAGNVWAKSVALQFAPSTSPLVAMNAGLLGVSGGNQPHDNMLPYLTINFIISLFGIYPSQT